MEGNITTNVELSLDNYSSIDYPMANGITFSIIGIVSGIMATLTITISAIVTAVVCLKHYSIDKVCDIVGKDIESLGKFEGAFDFPNDKKYKLSDDIFEAMKQRPVQATTIENSMMVDLAIPLKVSTNNFVDQHVKEMLRQGSMLPRMDELNRLREAKICEDYMSGCIKEESSKII